MYLFFVLHHGRAVSDVWHRSSVRSVKYILLYLFFCANPRKSGVLTIEVPTCYLNYMLLFPFFSIFWKHFVSTCTCTYVVCWHVMTSTLAHTLSTFVQTFLIWKNLFNFLYKIIVQTYLNLSNKFHMYQMLVDESLGFEARLFFRPFGFNFCKHFWEKHWIRRTRFDSGIESNTSFRNFVFVERQFKKPFVSKQDSSRISLD